MLARDAEPRSGRNQTLFREVNDRIAALSARLLQDEAEPGAVELLCECGDSSCTLTIAMSLADYADVRAGEGRFVLLPGHQDADRERIVADRGGFLVVERL